ncbi:MAG TPA: prolyl-tRNA synthetase associated domain-containing protein, partial [Hyphomicrobiaceae bacterium]|nr:prolyl-tRNA synthetase associated domain-containing protein [Hyphomicrobiaceae bacterium]
MPAPGTPASDQPIEGISVPATRQDLLARLVELGIATVTVDHAAVFTVAESSQLERQLPGGHTKNLFLKDKKDRL